jgi:hypothetical protein
MKQHSVCSGDLKWREAKQCVVYARLMNTIIALPVIRGKARKLLS